ncbi:MAG: PASTA domain-containing protein [Marinilabiliaceae bacterium]
MNFLKFLKTKLFWAQVGLAVAATIVLLVIANWALGVYTTSGRTVVVPQLVGHTQSEVESEVRNGDLSLVLIDSIYKPGEKPGVIVDQIPEAGKKVKKGRTIYVTINAFTKEMTTMPALVNYSYRNALVNIQNAGLVIGRVDSVPSPYDGLVLKQTVGGKDIKAGDRLPKGTAVSLVVGRGQAGGVTRVPDVRGLPYDEALVAIAGASMSLGNVECDATIRTASDSAMAIVYRQSPMASGESTVETWSSVNIWLTTDATKAAEGALSE